MVAVLDRLAVDNVGLCCDLFHLANNGDDIDAALAAYAPRIAHVQIADHPGRGEPGSGGLDLERYLAIIARQRLRRLRRVRVPADHQHHG